MDDAQEQVFEEMLSFSKELSPVQKIQAVQDYCCMTTDDPSEATIVALSAGINMAVQGGALRGGLKRLILRMYDDLEGMQ